MSDCSPQPASTGAILAAQHALLGGESAPVASCALPQTRARRC